jgi:hypothetical protein
MEVIAYFLTFYFSSKRPILAKEKEKKRKKTRADGVRLAK